MRFIHENKFLKDSFIYVFGAAAAGVFNYLFHVVVSRGLSVPQYGELQSLLAVFTIFGVLIVTINYFTIKHTAVFAEHDDRAATASFVQDARSAIFKYSLLLLGIFILLAPFLHAFLHLTGYAGLMAAFVSIIFSILAAVSLGALNGWGKFISVNTVIALGTILKFGFALLLVPLARVASSGMLAVLLSGAIYWLLAEFFLRKSFPVIALPPAGWRQKFQQYTDGTTTILPVFIFSLMVVVLGNIDVILVKNTTSAEITGLYGALEILGTIVLIVNMAIISVVLPKACATAHTGQGINIKMLLGAYGLMTITGAAAVLLYFFFPEKIISLLFGAKYLAAAPDLWLFSLMAYTLSLLLLEGHVAFAKRDYFISYVLAGTALGMMASILLLHQSIRQIILDITGVFMVGYLVTLGLNIHHRYKKVDQSLLPL